MTLNPRALPRPFFRVSARPLLLIAIALLLMVIVPSAWAGGRQENGLSKADSLIADRRYNEAILVLTAFIKANPDQFDDAQRRLQRIVRLRDEYNAVAAELLNVLVNDPTNDEHKLSMIRRLESLETAPNRSAREFLLRTKETAQFTYNRAQFDKIMGEGRALIDRGSWVPAALKYTEGFTLYRDDFDQAGYGDLVVGRVDSGLKTVFKDINLFEGMLQRLEAVVSRFEAAFSAGDLKAASASYAELEATFLEFARMRNELARAGRGLETQFLLLQGADKELGENSFLPFAYRFVLGRKTEVRPEGVLGSMDTLWIALANRAQIAAAGAADRSFDEAIVRFDRNDYLGASSSFGNTVPWAELAVRTMGLWSAVAGSETSPALTSYGRTIVNGKAPVLLRYQVLARTLPYFNTAALANTELDKLVVASLSPAKAWKAGTLSPGEAQKGIAASRASFVAFAQRMAGEQARLELEAARVRDFQGAKLAGAEVKRYPDRANEYLSLVGRRALSSETDLVVDQFAITVDEMDHSLPLRQAEADKARGLLAGVPSADGKAVAKYPRESLAILKDTEAEVGRKLADGAALLDAIRKQDERISGDERVLELARKSSELSATYTKLRADLLAGKGEASMRVDQAESARLEGDKYYEEARLALSRLNFDRARERVQRSGERYDVSLSIQESAALRSDRDSRLLALSAEITKTENELVVRDVRRLITQAKSDYYGGVFERAEESLVQAQNRWRTTNVADESEVSYWLQLVRSALSIRTGRTIPVTAPLYPEMSQLLSFAHRAFDDGRELLAQRRRVDALARFGEARKKIQEVKIVFPLNQEASLLLLRIDQLTDPDIFNANFRKRISEAVVLLSTKPQEAYSELQDLTEINPGYPGLNSALERAEILLGLRLPPPDRVALARSVELTAAARRIVNANLRSQFPVALEQLNEAVRLNPNNEEAVSLKDRIQTDAGGTASIVLSAAQEQDYQRAVQELQKGNTIVASAIVEQLLKDPRARNSPRILELQKRIQARL